MVVTGPAPGTALVPQAAPAESRARDLSPGVTRALLACAVAVGAVLRLVNLDAFGLNSDEAVYAGQAASLAGNPVYTPWFPVFRAHPMLVQSLLSTVYSSGEHDTAGRVVVAMIGLLTVLVVYLVGKELFDRRTGVVAALLLSVMSYHVLVTRQVLLDGPMVLFATLTLLCVAKYARTHRLSWMVVAGAVMGLAMLAKETSIVLVLGIYAFLALSPSIRRPVKGSLVACAALVPVFATHPLTQALAGHTSTGKSYLVWQLFRKPNHGWDFYFTTVPWAMGPLVLAAVLFGLLRARRTGEWSWRYVLLVCWIAAVVGFFELWPVKGFQYLLPAAPAAVILAARGLLALPSRASVSVGRREGMVRGLRPVAIGVVLVSLLAVSVPAAIGGGANRYLAGTGGVPGGREAGQWIDTNTPEGATVLTLGPSMANIVQYYGHRAAYGLSVSPNPLNRNPSYQPLVNPDREMRQGDLQYVVWDAYSAARSPHFSNYLLELMRRYHGRLVHTEFAQGAEPSGRAAPVPVIQIYEVRP